VSFSVNSRPPHASGGHDGFGDHAFWERLPFRGVPWTRALVVGLVCFGLWFLLDAPSLQRSAQESPLGTRRTVSLDMVGPVAALSRTVGLSSVVSGTARVLMCRTGGETALGEIADTLLAKAPKELMEAALGGLQLMNELMSEGTAPDEC